VRKVALVLFLLFVCGCGSSSEGAADAGDEAYGHTTFDSALPYEAGPRPTPHKTAAFDCDGGSGPTTTYPAPHPKMPLAVSSGGPVMKSPRFVPIVFSAEDRTSDIGAFMKAIAASTYWTSIATQYGVGTPSASSPIVVNETPAASITDSDIIAWLQDKLDGTHADFGAPDANAIYVVYYPDTTIIHQTSLGDSCFSFGGYHYETKVGATPIVYAVIARCKGEAMSSITAHELFEAATDPYFSSAPAYQSVDDPTELWSWGGEIGDLCEYLPDVVPSDVGYPVPPIWSNSASTGGRNPCQPSSGPYFRTVTSSTHVHLLPGETAMVDLVAFSDVDTGAPWSVTVTGNWGPPSDRLQLDLCKSTAQNGEHIPLGIFRSETALNGGNVRIDSTLGNSTTSWSISVDSAP
jgi:hypothetical protein